MGIVHQMDSVETPIPDSFTSSKSKLLADNGGDNFTINTAPTAITEEREEDLCSTQSAAESVHSEVAPIIPNPPQISISEMEPQSLHKSTFDQNLENVVDTNEEMMSNVVRDMALSQDETMLKMASLMGKIDSVERRKAVKKSTFDRQLDDVVDANERLMGNVVRDMAFSVTQKQENHNGNGRDKGMVMFDVQKNGKAMNEESRSMSSPKKKFKSIRDRIKYFDLHSPSKEDKDDANDFPNAQSLASIAVSPYKETESVLSSNGTMRFLQSMDGDDSV